MKKERRGQRKKGGKKKGKEEEEKTEGRQTHTSQSSSQEFLKEDTEGNCGGPGIKNIKIFDI